MLNTLANSIRLRAHAYYAGYVEFKQAMYRISITNGRIQRHITRYRILPVTLDQAYPERTKQTDPGTLAVHQGAP